MNNVDQLQTPTNVDSDKINLTTHITAEKQDDELQIDVPVEILHPSIGKIGEGVALAGRVGRNLHGHSLPNELHVLAIEKVDKDVAISSMGAVTRFLLQISHEEPEMMLSAKIGGFLPWPTKWISELYKHQSCRRTSCSHR